MARIHPSAIVAEGARLADEVEVGPFCTVGPDVEIGAGTRLISHCVVDGHTRIGAGCTLYPFCSVGLRTQDLKFRGGAPRTEIGDRTTIRECATIHAATADGDLTRVGSDCLIMAYAHVAHDCLVGNRVIMANVATLAGHVVVEDQAIVGGLAAVHQFVRIGRLAILGGCTKIVKDVPPFMTADGNPAEVRMINKLGLERAGFMADAQAAVKQAFRILYREGLTTSRAVERIDAELSGSPEVQELLCFVRGSQRGIT